jgi:hypothetical protein
VDGAFYGWGPQNRSPSLARHDRRDGDQVVGIGRVLEAEDEAEEYRGEERVR